MYYNKLIMADNNGPSTSTFHNMIDNIKNINLQSLLLKENFMSIALFVLFLLILIAVLIYYFIMKNISSK